MIRRSLFALLFLILPFIAMAGIQAPAEAAGRYPLTVTDALGREVTIRQAPRAVLLGSGFNLVALSLIHPDPVSLLAGWASDMKSDNPEIYASFEARFPRIATLPLIGDGVTVSLETALSLKADLILLANWQVESAAGRDMLALLEQAGLPVVVVNFNTDVVRQTPLNIRMLGRLFDREEQAEAFARFHEARIGRIARRIAALKEPRPRVLLDAFPNPAQCCYAYGDGGIGAFIALAGGINAAAGLPSQGAVVSPEFVLSSNPDVYIATASPGGRYSGFSIGPGVPEQEARESLRAAIGSPYLAGLKAVKERRVHGIWNFFNAVPINLVAAEAFARWLHPALFADVDPSATLADINRSFAAVPFEGRYFISLPDE